jgi:hypothetical protein
MSKVLIVAGGEKGPAASLKAAIAQSNPLTQVNICGVSELNSGAIAPGGAIVCPLTLDLPENLVFTAKMCFDFAAMFRRRAIEWLRSCFFPSARAIFGCLWC